MKACKGPGKTTLLAWFAWLFLLTRRHPKVICTSITGPNLKDGLWTEMAKWQAQSDMLKELFEYSATAIKCRSAPDTWWMVPRTWSSSASKDQQADTLAGKHADNMLFLLDEVGGYPDAVMAAAEAVLSGEGDLKIVIAGNPTQLSGPLFRAFTSERSLWYGIEITGDPDDPKRAKRVRIDWAREQIAKYGLDNDWVQVNVFGKFPKTSPNSLLGPNDMQRALGAHLRDDEYRFAQKRLGIDVARFGDDATCICPRQGLLVGRIVVLRGQPTDVVAARVALAKKNWDSEVEFIDASGGYGGGPVDMLRQGGITVHEVYGSGKPSDEAFFNKRSEMWFNMAKWVKGGGCLPNDPELAEELCAPTFTYQGGKIRVEEKEQVKLRLNRSPDKGDSLVLTFAWPDQPGKMGLPFERHQGGDTKMLHDRDPNF